MLSRMRRAESNEAGQLLKTLTGLEVNAAYPLDRLGPLPKVEVSLSKKETNIRMHLTASILPNRWEQMRIDRNFLCCGWMAKAETWDRTA